MRKWLCLWIMLWSLLTPLFSTQAQGFDRREMLSEITLNVILPYQQTLVEEAKAFQAAAYAFNDSPSDEILAALKDAWLTVALAWEHCEWLEFDRLMLYYTQIERIPANTEGIEEKLASDETLDAAALGSNIKGLSALEYLLWSDMSLTEPRRLEYLLILADDLVLQAETVYEFWSPEGKNYAETFIDADGAGTVLRESISMLNNQMVTEFEVILQNKLGRPLGILVTSTESNPEIVEAPFSEASIPKIIANLESLQAVFAGGFDDYLNFLEAEYEGEPLAEAIQARFDEAFLALDAINLPLQDAILDDPASIQAAYDAVRSLMILIRVDMAAQLGVTITFNDNDGD